MAENTQGGAQKRFTDVTARQAKYEGRPYKLATGEAGLYLLVGAASKLWRMNYRFAGRQKTLALGVYPDVGLADVRELHRAARKLLAAGTDPSEQRKADKKAAKQATANSFKAVAQQWIAMRAPTWSASHESKTRQLLERDVYPAFGEQPIDAITAAQVLAMARRVEGRGNVEMPRRAISVAGQVFRYAIGLGLVKNDPSQGMTGQLNDRPPVQHYPHVTTEELPRLLRALDALPASPTVLSVKLDMLAFVRGGELRTARWEEFDIDNKVWLVPPGRMKGRRWRKENGDPHVVPLSAQALRVLEELRSFTGHYQLLFPGRDDPTQGITGAAMQKVWQRIGYAGQQSTHGLRGLASTEANDSGLFDSRVIEAQLSHKEKDRIKAAYDHGQRLAARVRLMDWWGARLDALRAENVVPLVRKA